MLVSLKQKIYKKRLELLNKYNKGASVGRFDKELELNIKRLYLVDRFIAGWSDENIKNTEIYVRKMQSL